MKIAFFKLDEWTDLVADFSLRIRSVSLILGFFCDTNRERIKKTKTPGNSQLSKRYGKTNKQTNKKRSPLERRFQSKHSEVL